MIRLLILLLTCICLASCVSAKFNSGTGELSYKRWGDQKLGGVNATKASDGTFSLSFESQESQAQALNDAVKTLCNIAETAKNIS